MNETCPEIWIEIGEARKKRSLLCLYYREFSEWNQRETTNSISSQRGRFEDWLSRVGDQLEKNRELWLIGDFNLELERRFDHGYSRKSLAVMAQSELIERGLVQIIDETTHRQNGH